MHVTTIGHPEQPTGRDAGQRGRARSLCAEKHAGFTRLGSLCPMNIEAPLQHLGPELFAREEGLRGDPARVGTLIEDALRASGRPLPVRRLRRGERLLCPGGNAHAELRAAGVGYRGQLRGATGRSSGRVRVGRRRAGRTRLRRRERALPPGAGGTGLKHRTAKAVDFAPHRRLTMRHEHARCNPTSLLEPARDGARRVTRVGVWSFAAAPSARLFSYPFSTGDFALVLSVKS